MTKIIEKYPLLEIVAGPNGSGKTTFAESYLVGLQKRTNYLNPDLIAAAVTPGLNGTGQFKAGRILLGQLKQSIENKEDVAFESTLSGKTYLNILELAKRNGYKVHIYFLYLDDQKLNIHRIKERVKMGGHSVPTKDVIRRFKRSFNNFWLLYRSFCESWVMVNNSNQEPYVVINSKSFDQLSSQAKLKFEQNFLKGRILHGKK